MSNKRVKKGSIEAKANVASRIAKAKVRVKHQDYDNSNSPATLSPTMNYLRKKRRESELKDAGKKAYNSVMNRKGMKETKGRR